MASRLIRARPAAAPVTPENLGEKKFRRVWYKGRGRDSEPHWYFWAHTKEGAINAAARANKEPAVKFDSE